MVQPTGTADYECPLKNLILSICTITQIILYYWYWPVSFYTWWRHQMETFSVNTPVTQDGDLAAICKIGRIAADRHWVAVRSHRAPWQRCRSQWGPQGRRDRRQVFNILKTSAVRSPRKQVAVASQQTRCMVAGGTPIAPWHRSDVAQGARSIAIGSLSGYA